MKIMPRSCTNAEKINRLHAVAIRMAVDSRNSLRLALSAAWKAGQLLICPRYPFPTNSKLNRQTPKSASRSAKPRLRRSGIR
jgi:hypothetical protein